MKLARLLVDVNAQDLGALRMAWTRRDASAITHHAHRVLGATLVLQETELVAAARTLEDASGCRNPDWETLNRLIDTLASAMDAYRSRVGLSP